MVRFVANSEIDKVSQLLGKLDEKTDNISEKIGNIEKQLYEINGSVAKHQIKMASCDEKFNNLQKGVSSVKWDYKFWGAITGLVVVITTAFKLFGF